MVRWMMDPLLSHLILAVGVPTTMANMLDTMEAWISKWY